MDCYSRCCNELLFHWHLFLGDALLYLRYLSANPIQHSLTTSLNVIRVICVSLWKRIHDLFWSHTCGIWIERLSDWMTVKSHQPINGGKDRQVQVLLLTPLPRSRCRRQHSREPQPPLWPMNRKCKGTEHRCELLHFLFFSGEVLARERVRCPQLHTGAFTYLLLSDEKEVRRNWRFNKGKQSPHLEALSVPFFASPAPDPPVLGLEEVSGGVRCETSCWKGTPERFTLESCAPHPQHPSALARYLSSLTLAGLNFLEELLLSDVHVRRVVYLSCYSSWSRLLR